MIGNVTSADVVIALRIAVSGEFAEEADIDENGCVNALDACTILRAAADNIEICHLPAEQAAPLR